MTSSDTIKTARERGGEEREESIRLQLLNLPRGMPVVPLPPPLRVRNVLFVAGVHPRHLRNSSSPLLSRSAPTTICYRSQPVLTIYFQGLATLSPYCLSSSKVVPFSLYRAPLLAALERDTIEETGGARIADIASNRGEFSPSPY
ncbi:hypothetical protein BHE74_00003298 [Ensete ventricosum]|nr:hypothetical protein GW17_00011513 [Ensete ventricosum]RWW87856.1 hypothetical protein BHE74_00003298 [Ensete ventricosum]RZR75605.1 hypothetical protein BHM03_00000018 [Ensete ventricosum]